MSMLCCKAMKQIIYENVPNLNENTRNVTKQAIGEKLSSEETKLN